jgi:hypothetical protein
LTDIFICENLFSKGLSMPIKVQYIRYLFALTGVLLLFAALSDKNWGLAGAAVLLTIGLGLLGYGVERLWFYINRNPGGTRLSRFLIGR